MPEMPDAIILCGGAGLRLRSVTGDLPKVMAGLAGQPFLELLLHQLRGSGFRRVVMAVGYRGDVVSNYFGTRACGLELVYSVETSPLGTGGALRQAADRLETSSVMVLNGDSYTGADLAQFVANHAASAADVSVLVVPADGRHDCGMVLTDETGRVVRFDEKLESSESPYINAGIYALARQLLYDIPEGRQSSLEKEIIPGWITEGRRIRVVRTRAACVDIGTPERYREAQRILASVERSIENCQCESQR